MLRLPGLPREVGRAPAHHPVAQELDVPAQRLPGVPGREQVVRLPAGEVAGGLSLRRHGVGGETRPAMPRGAPPGGTATPVPSVRLPPLPSPSNAQWHSDKDSVRSDRKGPALRA